MGIFSEMNDFHDRYLDEHGFPSGGSQEMFDAFIEEKRANNLAANPNYYEEDDGLSNDDVDF